MNQVDRALRAERNQPDRPGAWLRAVASGRSTVVVESHRSSDAGKRLARPCFVSTSGITTRWRRVRLGPGDPRQCTIMAEQYQSGDPPPHPAWPQRRLSRRRRRAKPSAAIPFRSRIENNANTAGVLRLPRSRKNCRYGTARDAAHRNSINEGDSQHYGCPDRRAAAGEPQRHSVMVRTRL